MRCLFAVIGIFPFLTFAQTKTIDTKVRPEHNAVAISEVPIVDGEVINDPLWQGIVPITELTQIQPNVGLPASERTEIRIAYDRETFYVSVVCFDSQPAQLVVTDSRRDAALDEADAFLFILDT
jgi:hypothetical protein